MNYTPEQQREIEAARLRLIEIAKEYADDPEVAHQRADDVLCDLLFTLDCKEVVAEYEKVEKWYA